MGFADRFKRFFGGGRRNPFLAQLESFAATHEGVEGFIEPQTATTPTTLLLVDRHGEHVRGPVDRPEDGVRFCNKRGIPIYDAAVVGYPRRMRDYEPGRRSAQDAWDARFKDIEKQFREPEEG